LIYFSAPFILLLSLTAYLLLLYNYRLCFYFLLSSFINSLSSNYCFSFCFVLRSLCKFLRFSLSCYTAAIISFRIFVLLSIHSSLRLHCFFCYRKVLSHIFTSLYKFPLSNYSLRAFYFNYPSVLSALSLL
jgi:hypothetical protein